MNLLAASVFLAVFQLHLHEDGSEDLQWISLLPADNGHRTPHVVCNRGDEAVPVTVRAFNFEGGLADWLLEGVAAVTERTVTVPAPARAG